MAARVRDLGWGTTRARRQRPRRHGTTRRRWCQQQLVRVVLLFLYFFPRARTRHLSARVPRAVRVMYAGGRGATVVRARGGKGARRGAIRGSGGGGGSGGSASSLQHAVAVPPPRVTSLGGDGDGGGGIGGDGVVVADSALVTAADIRTRVGGDGGSIATPLAYAREHPASGEVEDAMVIGRVPRG